jgi:hypothetical protein
MRHLGWLLLLLAPTPVFAAPELKVLPGSLALVGTRDAHGVRVVLVEQGTIVADRTSGAKLTSSNPKVVAVQGDGSLRGVGDGEATITATSQGQTATAKVTVTGAAQPHPWSFRNQVVPVLTRAGCNSGACHGALAGKGGLKLSLRGYDPDADFFVLTRQAQGRRIDVTHPASSLLLLKPTMTLRHGGGEKLTPGSDDYAAVAGWIAQGAVPPKAEDVRIDRLEQFTTRARLAVGDKLRVLVRGSYTDGSTADVTRWAKFVSSDEQVALVDSDGNVSIMGQGEAAITALFGSRVATMRVTVPFKGEVPAEAFQAVEANEIDKLVMAKLRTLNLPPSPLCDDATFIRRLFLDALGILPTPEEVAAFVKDTDPKRREKLIDTVLARPEFVDYWTYKWAELFLVSSKRLAQPPVWSFYQHLRRQVADNTPWDRMARDILTAQGSNLENGAGVYFVLHKDVSDLTETTALTFLGTSITCARCHNHPLEKWTQDQYWSLANLFSRVGLKNGDKTGEVFVQTLPSGEALHLRRGIAMPPTPLDGKPLPLDSDTDRRAYFADWLTSKDNPYFAKAMVNRLWRNFLGRGLVEAEDDFRQTNPPTNEELLDWLAKDFIDHGYDIKHTIRTVVRSATYQRSSEPRPQNAADDRFYSRYLVRRLPAEVILDVYSQVTGTPTPFDKVVSGGRDALIPYAGYPLGTRALQLPDSLVASRFLDAFGRAERSQTCSCEVTRDASVGQALHVNNGQTLNDKLRAKTSRIEAWLKEDISDEVALDRVYAHALARKPTPTEKTKFLGLLAAARKEGTGRREVLEDVFWAVLTSKEFLFNH